MGSSCFKVSLLFLTSLVYAGEIDTYTFNDGKKIYEKTCISCHGVDGNTNSSMKLVVKPRKLTKTILTPEQSFEIIKEGARYWGAHSDIMPTFKYVYEDHEIEDVNYYITHAFSKNSVARVKKFLDESEPITAEQKPKMLKMGEKIFNRNCSMCHGITGDGESEYVEMSKADNTFIYPYNLTRTLLTEEQIFLYAKFGGKFWGTAEDHMPSWKRKYSDFQLKSVAKYVNENIKKVK